MKNGEDFNPYKVFNGVFIPNCIVEATDIPPSAKLLYGLLSSYAGQNGKCYPPQSELAEKLNLKEDTIKRILYLLSDTGYIKIINPEGIDRLRHYNNSYKFLWKDNFEGSLKTNKSDSQKDEASPREWRAGYGRHGISTTSSPEVDSDPPLKSVGLRSTSRGGFRSTSLGVDSDPPPVLVDLYSR
jgi:hypothetical protein